MDYDVIATGSKGNAVRIQNILIDAGIPYKNLKEHLYKVDNLFLTHRHSDHVKPPTIAAIRKNFPHIRIIGNYDIGYTTDLDMISNDYITIKLRKDLELVPFKCVHDVPCQGLVLRFGELEVIYATDTHTMEYAPEGLFDYLFLESNHDEGKIRQLIGKKNKYGYDVFAEGVRHLSTQQAKAFYYTRRRSKESPFIELHQSSRFY